MNRGLNVFDENRGTLVFSAMVTMMQPCVLRRDKSSVNLCIVYDDPLHLLSLLLLLLQCAFEVSDVRRVDKTEERERFKKT